jgi:hypothetical protein
MVITTIDSFVHASLVRWHACVTDASYFVPLEMLLFICISNMLLYIRLWSEKRSGEESQAQSALYPIFVELDYARVCANI